MFSSPISSEVCNSILAKGLPALSPPIGFSAICESSSGFRNFDCNIVSQRVLWPRHSSSEYPGWRHSDIKNIAFPFVSGLFTRFMEFMRQ